MDATAAGKPARPAGDDTDSDSAEEPADKAKERTVPSALCLALLGAMMAPPPAPEPMTTTPGINGGDASVTDSAAGNSAGTPPKLAAGALGPSTAATAGVRQADTLPPGDVAIGAPGAAMPKPAARDSAAASTAPVAAAPVHAPLGTGTPVRATAEVMAKLGITPPPPARPVAPSSATARPTPLSQPPLSPEDRSARLAGLPIESPRADAALGSGKDSELLIRQTGGFARTPDAGGTDTAQKPAMFHDAHALRSDSAVTSVFHAESVLDAPADAASGANATLDLHAAAAHAVDAVSVAVEHASRVRNSVKLDFDIAGERVAVVVERHADEIRATFKADSADLRAALSQQWQASAADRATSTVQPVFTDHASSHSLPDSGSQGFARQDDSPGQPGGEAPARRDLRRRRDSQRVAAATTVLSATPLHSRLPAFRPGTSLHLSTTA